MLNKVSSEIETIVNDIELFKMASSLFLLTWKCALLSFGDPKSIVQLTSDWFFWIGVIKLNIYFCGSSGYSLVNSTVTLSFMCLTLESYQIFLPSGYNRDRLSSCCNTLIKI